MKKDDLTAKAYSCAEKSVKLLKSHKSCTVSHVPVPDSFPKRKVCLRMK